MVQHYLFHVEGSYSWNDDKNVLKAHDGQWDNLPQ